jgi:Domain of unknown function (DUF4382)
MDQLYAKPIMIMKTRNILSFASLMAIAVVIFATACNKSNSFESAAGQQSLSLYLTDGPGLFDKVLLDIKSVKVLVDTSKDTRKHDNCNWNSMGADDRKKDSGFVWHDLGIKAGIYDLLQLRNGTDTLLAEASITKGSIRLIKIELGTNNSLVKDSVSYPLSLPAGAQNFVLIETKGHEYDEYLPGRNRIWLDFDVARSIVQERNGTFYLRPVFHFFTKKLSGNIVGRITPQRDAKAVITIYNATDTAYALPTPEGYFNVRCLKDGTYSVFVNASSPYIDTTINNVVVTAPKETSLGLITLKK